MRIICLTIKNGGDELKILSKIYVGVIFLFLYAPLVVLVVFSFNESKSRNTWTGFSLKWYEKLVKYRVSSYNVYERRKKYEEA